MNPVEGPFVFDRPRAAAENAAGGIERQGCAGGDDQRAAAGQSAAGPGQLVIDCQNSAAAKVSRDQAHRAIKLCRAGNHQRRRRVAATLNVQPRRTLQAIEIDRRAL